jgi:hypothetical protein
MLTKPLMPLKPQYSADMSSLPSSDQRLIPTNLKGRLLIAIDRILTCDYFHLIIKLTGGLRHFAIIRFLDLYRRPISRVSDRLFSITLLFSTHPLFYVNVTPRQRETAGE